MKKIFINFSMFILSEIAVAKCPKFDEVQSEIDSLTDIQIGSIIKISGVRALIKLLAVNLG